MPWRRVKTSACSWEWTSRLARMLAIWLRSVLSALRNLCATGTASRLELRRRDKNRRHEARREEIEAHDDGGHGELALSCTALRSLWCQSGVRSKWITRE